MALVGGWPWQGSPAIREPTCAPTGKLMYAQSSTAHAAVHDSWGTVATDLRRVFAHGEPQLELAMTLMNH